MRPFQDFTRTQKVLISICSVAIAIFYILGRLHIDVCRHTTSSWGETFCSIIGSRSYPALYQGQYRAYRDPLNPAERR
jgi:hypothetical protein